jgi:hypothetical protein
MSELAFSILALIVSLISLGYSISIYRKLGKILRPTDSANESHD